MASIDTEDNLTLPLLKPVVRGPLHPGHTAPVADRFTPAVAGGTVGLAAGALALGTVHLLAAGPLLAPVEMVARTRGVDPAVALAIAYATSAALGALVGATFALVTRYLRKTVPLAIWGLVFFTSLAMLLLAVAGMNGRGPNPALSLPILAASAVYGLAVSFSLPIRRRR